MAPRVPRTAARLLISAYLLAVCALGITAEPRSNSKTDELRKTNPSLHSGVMNTFPGNTKMGNAASSLLNKTLNRIVDPKQREAAEELFSVMLNPRKVNFKKLMEDAGQDNMKNLDALLLRFRTMRQERHAEVEGPGEGVLETGVPAEAEPDIVEKYFNQWAEGDPENPAPLEELAKDKAKLKDYRGTIAAADRAQERGSAVPEVIYLRGAAYEKLGDHEAAHRDAARVLKVQPKNRKAVALYKLTRGQISKIYIDVSGAALAKEVVVRDVRSQAYAGDAKTADLLRRSNVILKEAVTSLAVKDFPAAAQRASRALELDPRNAQAYQVLASVAISQGDYRGALAYASKGVAADPDSLLLLNTRSFAASRVGDYGAGLRDSAEAIRRAPKSALGYFNRAYAQAGLGRREKAIRDLARAAKLDKHFERKFRQAMSLPEDQLTALFEEVLGGSSALRKASASRRSPFGTSALALIGGLLIAFGLVAAVMRPGGRLSALFKRRDPGGDEDAIPDSAFWRRYDVIREIAAGGMGIVYEAHDRSLGRQVAIKRMRDEISRDPRERERFLNEARIVARMRHPNIVEIYSIEEDGDDAYLVFEYVDGKTLHEILHDKKRLSYAGSCEILRGVCNALEYAHKRGIVHRDLKLANIMVDRDGVSKVMDFGIARQSGKDGAPMETNTIAGTVPYMAPEQEEGIIRPECDVYALGVCLYELLSGELPFQGTAGAMLLAKREGKYIPLARAIDGVPKDISKVIDLALAPNPAERIRTPRDFLAALEKAVATQA